MRYLRWINEKYPNAAEECDDQRVQPIKAQLPARVHEALVLFVENAAVDAHEVF